MKYQYNYNVEINWSTLIETGEILNKESSLALSIFNPDKIQHHNQVINVVSITCKRAGDFWNESDKIDIANHPVIKQIKNDYPTTHYFISANWSRI